MYIMKNTFKKMSCCVSFCKNSSSPISQSQKVTFHEFPTNQRRRDEWLTALGMEENNITDTTAVCSLHFRKADFQVVKGLKMLQKKAVPSAVQLCLICLRTDIKLYPMRKNLLGEAYTNVTGLKMPDDINFAQLLCAECAHKLKSCNRFRDHCLRAHKLLLELVINQEVLTTKRLNKIDRDKYKISSNLVTRKFKPNHCDIHVVEQEDESIEPETNMYNLLKKMEVKRDVKETLQLVLEPLDLKYDNEINESDEEFLNDDIDNDIDFLNDNKVPKGNNVQIKLPHNTDAEIDNMDFSNISDIEQLSDIDIDTDEESVNVRKNSRPGLLKHNNEVRTDNSDNEFDDNDISNMDDVEMLSEEDTFSNDETLFDVNKSVQNKTVVKRKPIASDEEIVFDDNLNKNVAKPKGKRVVKKVEKTPEKPDTQKRLRSLPVPKSFTENVMTFAERLEDVLDRMDSANYRESPHKCTLCFRGFSSVMCYNRHMLKHTDKYGDVECILCKLRFRSNSLLNHHIRTFHTAKYSCMVCPYVTRQKHSAALHERWHEGKKYKCPHCDAEMSRKTTYMSHIRFQHPSDIACELCGYSFVSELGLRLHKTLRHKFEDVQNPEEATGPLCEPCNIRFVSETAYNQHLHVSPRHAPLGMRLRNEPNERRSVGRVRYVTCEECGLKLDDVQMYRSHFTNEHPGKTRSQNPNRKIYMQKKNKKPCLCEHCGKVFKSPYMLKYHMHVHTGQKGFQCEVCKKSYTQKAVLRTHMQTHSEQRPSFQCPVCHKSFSLKSNVSKHMLIHKNLIFKCHLCDKSFGTTSTRKEHVLHVHLNKPWPKRKRGPRGQSSRGGQEKIKTVEDEWTAEYVTIKDDQDSCPETLVIDDESVVKKRSM